MYGSTPTRVIIIFETRHTGLIMASLNVLVKLSSLLTLSPCFFIGVHRFLSASCFYFHLLDFLGYARGKYLVLQPRFYRLPRDRHSDFQGQYSLYVFPFVCSIWWPTTVTAKPKTSRQKQKHHGKTKNLTAKAKASRQNQKPHGKNKIPHGKTKNLTAEINSLTAKPNTSQQKQNIFGFVVSIYTVPLTDVRIKRVDFRENIWAFYRDKRNCPYKACVRIKRVFVERGSTVITILFTCGDVWVVPMTPAPKQYTVLH